MAITYEHLCHACQHEWEAQYSIKANPPTVCPSCETEGQVERLISGGNGKGIMILTGRDLKEKLVADGKTFARQVATNEKVAANFYGEERYQQQQLQKEKLTKELVKIGQDASKIKSTDVKPSKAPVVKRVSDT